MLFLGDELHITVSGVEYSEFMKLELKLELRSDYNNVKALLSKMFCDLKEILLRFSICLQGTDLCTRFPLDCIYSGFYRLYSLRLHCPGMLYPTEGYKDSEGFTPYKISMWLLIQNNNIQRVPKTLSIS